MPISLDRYRECDVSEQHGIATALAPSQTKATDQEACKRACLNNNKFLCRSYVFDPVSGLCRFGPDDTYVTVLLPSSSARMTPYKQINECMDVVVFCEHRYISAHFRSNRVFDGKVLSLNSSSGCQFNVDKRFDFNVTIPLDKTARCGISPVASGIVSTLIKLQYHDIVWTTKDRFYRLICNYTPRRNSIDNFVDVSVPKNRVQTTKEVGHYREQVSNQMPTAYMRIIDNDGALVSEAEEGQPLFIEIKLQENQSGKQFFVTDCVAYEKYKKTLLIDERGCPTNRSIMDEFHQIKWGSKGAQRARFWGLPSNDQKRVNIYCNVNFCPRDCPSPNCRRYNNGERGKRKRKELFGSPPLATAETITVSQSYSCKQHSDNESDEDQQSKYSLAICCSISCAAIVLAIIITVLWKKCQTRGAKTKDQHGSNNKD
ncbi:hypothetical protein M513_07505, partial [Trichuris suis]